MDKTNKLIRGLAYGIEKSALKVHKPAAAIKPGDSLIRIFANSIDSELGEITVKISYGANAQISYGLPNKKISVTRPLPLSPNSQNDVLFEKFSELMNNLSGKYVEIDTVRKTTFVKDNWDSWWSIAGDAYDQLIHPAVLKTVSKYQANLPPGNVIDLFGGDGRLANKLNKLPKLKNRLLYILDNHPPSLKSAERKFNTSKNIHVQKPIDLSQSTTIFKNIGRPALVTIVGGICSSVVTRQQALNIMNQVYAALTKKGECIITGFTPVLLSSDDFNKLGFRIEQCSIPKNIITMKKPEQMYVLIK